MAIAPETLMEEVIKPAIKSIIDAKEFKILIIDSDGNIVGDIPISALRDALKPTRATSEHVLASQSIGAGDKAEFTVSDTDGYSAIVVTVKATYDSSATQGIRVRWLYSPNGTDFDSEEDAEDQGNYVDLTFSAGATRQRTVLIPILSDFIRIQIVNLDSSVSVTVDAWTLKMR